MKDPLARPTRPQSLLAIPLVALYMGGAVAVRLIEQRRGAEGTA